MTYRVTFPEATYDVDALSPFEAVYRALFVLAQDVTKGVIMPVCVQDEQPQEDESQDG